jgi:hypothetical protein
MGVPHEGPPDGSPRWDSHGCPPGVIPEGWFPSVVPQVVALGLVHRGGSQCFPSCLRGGPPVRFPPGVPPGAVPWCWSPEVVTLGGPRAVSGASTVGRPPEVPVRGTLWKCLNCVPMRGHLRVLPGIPLKVGP